MDLKEIANIFQSISVILACFFAMYSIDAWRREFIGKRRMELAEEVLALFYQARDIIHAIRNPFGFAGEGATRKADPAESPEQKDALDRAYVVVERFNQHHETFNRIHALRYRFMAQFGQESVTPFNELNKIVNEIFSAAHRLGRYWGPSYILPRAQERVAEHYNRVEEAEKIFWAGFNDDPIQPRVDAVVEKIEKICSVIINSKGTLFGLINLPIGKRRG